MLHYSLRTLSTCIFAATLLFACGSDDSDPTPNPNPNPDEQGGAITPPVDVGKDNTTDDVVTGGIPEISCTNATVYGYVNNHSQDALGFGIAYAPSEDISHLSLDDLKNISTVYSYIENDRGVAEAASFDPGTDNRRFTVQITNLKPNTTYSYYAYAGKMTANQVLKFTTPPIVLKTGEATDVGMFSATLHGSTNAYTLGFMYSTHPDMSDSIVVWSFGSDTSLKVNDLAAGTTYYYKSCAGNSSNPYYYTMTVRYRSEDIKSFTTTNLCPDNNHPHAVDLGLPSGTKWACCNVGAVHPDSLGNLYAWGETWPKNDNYLYDDQNIGEDIAGTQYDAATVNWGSGWRMPNEASFRELFNNTRQVNVYGKGIYCVANNEKAIFLRADKWQHIYWLSECENSYNDYWAQSLEINWYSYNNVYETKYSSRIEYNGKTKRSGFPIRPVRAN